MVNLGHFIERLDEAGAEIVQDFPPWCVPIRRGRVILPIDPYVGA
jgi:hypothetical protein